MTFFQVKKMLTSVLSFTDTQETNRNPLIKAHLINVQMTQVSSYNGYLVTKRCT